MYTCKCSYKKFSCEFQSNSSPSDLAWELRNSFNKITIYDSDTGVVVFDFYMDDDYFKQMFPISTLFKMIGI